MKLFDSHLEIVQVQFRYIKPGQIFFYYETKPPQMVVVFIRKKDVRYVWYTNFVSSGNGGFTIEDGKTTFDYWNEDLSNALKIESNHMQAAIMQCFGDMRWYLKM